MSMQSLNDKQRERQQRGEDFQAEVRRSWRLVPNCWRMRIADGRGGTRPADEIILLADINVLAEHKRTQGDRFELSFMRPNQIKGLLDFDSVIGRNMGLVFVSFNDDNRGIDEAYAFRLIDAMRFMQAHGRQYITKGELTTLPWTLQLYRLDIEGEPGYNLEGVNACFKYYSQTT